MAPGGLVEVRVSWPGHPRYLKKKNKKKKKKILFGQAFDILESWFLIL